MTQQEQILSYLREHNEGLNSYYATYTLGIKQAPTRILELRRMGYVIVPTNNVDRSVTWHLISESARKAVIKQEFAFIGNKAVLVENLKPVQGSLL